MKKIAAFILAICIVLTTAQIFVISAETEADPEYRESWSVFKGLNLISFSDEQKTEAITRGEFAAIIAKVLGLVPGEEAESSAYAASFGKPENTEGFAEEVTEENTEQAVFGDVPDFHPYYEAIKAITTYKIMNGNGNGNFNPNAVLKYEEAIKTFVLICGYDSRALLEGGWFNGYQSVARRIGILLDGKSIGQQLTKEELVEIFYKVFDVAINDVRGVKSDVVYYESAEDHTFLTEYMNIGCVEGQVTAVENSTLTAPITSLTDTIVVDGKTIRNKNAIRTNEYLGRTVKAYYDLTDGADTLLYITYSSRDDVFTIQAENLGGYSNGTLAYFNGNGSKHYNIKNLPIIYNGTAKTSYTSDIFDFQFGDVTITKNGKNDVVIIHDYRDMIISAVSINEMTLYGKDSGKQLLLDESNLVYIYNSGREEIAFEDLVAELPVTYLEGENYTEVWVCPAAKVGSLKSFNAASKKIVIGDTEYILSDETNATEISGYLGKEIKFYCNIFGAVFGVELNSSGSEKAGCLVGLGKTSVLENNKARFFMADGKFADYSFADKVTVYRADSADAVKVSGQNVNGVTALNGYRGFVTYKLNSNNEITMIQIPYESRNLKKDGDGRTWTKKVDTTNRTNIYSTTTYSIGTQIYLDASVKFFSVPTDGAVDDYRIVNFNGIPNMTSFGNVWGYYSDFADPIPDAVVVRDWSPSSNLAVVTELETGINEDGEPRKTATVTDATGAKTTIYSDVITTDQSGNECTAFDAAWVDFATDKKAVEVGDIIAYTTEYGKNDEVTVVVLIYDCSAQNISGGKKGYLAQATLGSDLYYTAVDIDAVRANSTGYYTASEIIAPQVNITGSLNRQNPFRVEPNAETVFKTDGHRDYNGGRKFMLGYVAEKTDAFVYLTTQDLSLKDAVYDADGIPQQQKPCPTPNVNYKGVYWQEWFKFVNNGGYLLTVEYYDNGIEVRKGVPADIYSYEDAKNEASRVLADPAQKRYYVINDYRTR